MPLYVLLSGGYEITGTATAASFVAALIAVMLQVYSKLRKSPFPVISSLKSTSNGLTFRGNIVRVNSSLALRNGTDWLFWSEKETLPRTFSWVTEYHNEMDEYYSEMKEESK